MIFNFFFMAEYTIKYLFVYYIFRAVLFKVINYYVLYRVALTAFTWLCAIVLMAPGFAFSWLSGYAIFTF